MPRSARRDGGYPSGKRSRRDPARKPPRTSASPARLAALEACRIVRERDAYAQEVIHARIDRSPLSPVDRGFATLLVLGVVSTWGVLDELIDRSLRSPDDVKLDVRDALRISAYELLFLGKQPYAVVDQGVELVRAIAPRAAGLANAALRSLTRVASEFPFGDPAHDRAALARSFGFPAWVADMLSTQLGDEAAKAFMSASNEPAPLFMAENPLKAAVGEVARELARAKAEVEPFGGVEGCYRVAPARVLADGRIEHMIAEGKALISDASSQMVAASVLPDKKPCSLLEVGAGRGTKTILLEAAAYRRWGSLVDRHVAVDSHGFKTDLLAQRMRAYGLEGIETVAGDARKLPRLLPGRSFDFAFVDAPCSGLGTLRRHPEIRWRLTPAHIEDLAATQLALLRSAARMVAPGGTLAYATCTVTQQENLQVVKEFLASSEGTPFSLAPIGGKSCFAPALASGTPDAHFAVRFRRKG